MSVHFCAQASPSDSALFRSNMRSILTQLSTGPIAKLHSTGNASLIKEKAVS